MNIGRIFAHAIVRRIAYVLVALVLAYIGIGKVHAQANFVKYCNGSTAGRCDQGTALAECTEYTRYFGPEYAGRVVTRDECVAQDDGDGNPATGRWLNRFWQKDPGGVENGPYNDEQFVFDKGCNTRGTDYAGFVISGGSATKCSAGCSYTRTAITETITIKGRTGVAKEYTRASWAPTGGACTGTEDARPPPQDSACHLVEGGYNVCKKADGKVCVTSPKTGRTYCGALSAGMNATNPDRTENASASIPAPPPGQPAQPPVPRPGEDWQQQAGATVTNNTTNNTTNVAVHGNAGAPNTMPGSGVPGDGSDNPGTGGTGDGGNGEGEGQPDWTKVDGMDTSPGADRSPSEMFENGDEEFVPDDSPFLGGGECRQPPDVTLPNGQVLHFDIAKFCYFLEIGSYLVLLFAALACGKIIGGAF